jgi:hypothetical protein
MSRREARMEIKLKENETPFRMASGMAPCWTVWEEGTSAATAIDV